MGESQEKRLGQRFIHDCQFSENILQDVLVLWLLVALEVYGRDEKITKVDGVTFIMIELHWIRWYIIAINVFVGGRSGR